MAFLKQKSLTELRGIAQSFGISDIFSKTNIQLAQEIELKQQKLIPPVAPPIPKPEYDARLMTRPPSKTSNQDDIIALLKDHISRGLHVTFPEPDKWEMRFGNKNDSGTTRMPLRTILNCANAVLK